MVRRRFVLAAALALLGTTACGDRTVELVAAAENANVEIEQLTLGLQLRGGFDLVLSLGSVAPTATTVTAESFGLVDADDGTPAAGSLQLLPRGGGFPVSVAPGATERVTLDIDDSELRPDDELMALCAASLRYVGAVNDSATERRTSFESAPIQVGGCP